MACEICNGDHNMINCDRNPARLNRPFKFFKNNNVPPGIYKKTFNKLKCYFDDDMINIKDIAIFIIDIIKSFNGNFVNVEYYNNIRKSLSDCSFIEEFHEQKAIIFDQLRHSIKDIDVPALQQNILLRCVLRKVDEDKISCKWCPLCCSSFDELMQHHHKEHCKIVDQFNCPYPKCKSILKSWKSLKAHMKTHTTEFICEICGKQFASKYSRIRSVQ